MDSITDELFSVPGTTQTLVVVVRIVAAGLLGAVIGGERELEGKAAGLRTHMLVALGAALFVIAPREAGLRGSEIASVVQGVAAGIGFIGAGTILKLADRQQIKGLTTAASIWMTAADRHRRRHWPALGAGAVRGVRLGDPLRVCADRKKATSPDRS